MGVYRSMGGSLRIKLTGADVTDSMGAINGLGIPVRKIAFVDELSVIFSVGRKSFPTLCLWAEKRGDRVEILGNDGIFWSIPRIMSRPVLIFGIMLLLFCSLYLPGRILFLSVEGNSNLPDRKILEAAEKSGIHFGVSRRNLRSEAIKNTLLSELPELQWAGVNTFGCRAVISVRERSLSGESKQISPLSNIVAARDAVISSITVTEGSGQCVPGQAVKKGQILISGYVDSGIVVRATGAEGEVMGYTSRKFKAVTPRSYILRTATVGETVKYSIRFGKKRINLYKGSGISVGSCVKMYTEYVLTLPGGFKLPVTFVKECISDQNVVNVVCAPEDATRLSGFAECYLKEQMVSGVVHSASEQVEITDDLIRLSGRYVCTELIGRYQNELIGEYHGKSDGTNRERGSGG